MTSMWNAESDMDFDLSTGNGDRWENEEPNFEEMDPRAEEGYVEEWDAWAEEVGLYDSYPMEDAA